MNKVFNKIALAFTGLAMAIGVGVALNREYEPARADDIIVNVSDVAAADPTNWTNESSHKSWSLNSDLTISTAGTGNNGKYYTSNTSWRLYEGNNGTLTLSGVDGVTLSSVTFTYAKNNNGVLYKGTNQYTTGTAITNISAQSLTLDGVTHSSGTKSGRVDITSIAVTYTKSAGTIHTITYNANGAAGGSTSDTQDNKVNSNGFTFNAGAYFRRWNTQADGKGKDYAVGATVSSDITLYCIWGYKVTYKANGGTGSDIEDYTLKNTSYTVAANTFARSNYAFTGWKTGASSGTDYAAGDTISTPSAAITLYAQWIQTVTATYTVSTKTSVTTTGTTPTGSSATYSQTYTGTAGQMTQNNSITLTLSGYTGCTIVGLTLSMKSNGSSGAGSMSLVSSSTTISSIADSKFNTTNWYGGWSTSFVDVAPTVASTKITNDNTIILTISASASSLYFQSATIRYIENTEARVVVSTTTPSIQYDGSGNQTIPFTATATNFGGETITYTWQSNNTSVISVDNVGSSSTANLKVVGGGTNVQVGIRCVATSATKTATSAYVTVTVTNETYSGTLVINNDTTANINDTGTISYTLTGNTHPMDVVTYTSSSSAIVFADSHNSAFTTGSTKGTSATVTVSLSSTTYSLETYQKSITITLVDPNSVTGVHFSGNITSKNVNFGGDYNLTAVLESISGEPTDTLVSWESADTSILTVPANHTGLTCPLTPVNVGTTTVTVTTHDGGFTKTCTVNVNSSSTRVLDEIVIELGEDAKTDYYDDETEVVLDDISLSAHFSDPKYEGYDETVEVAVDADGIEWTLDLENKKVIVEYTIDEVTVSDEFDITVSERPTIRTFDLTSTGYTGAQIASAQGITEDPINIIATETGSTDWRTQKENLRMYSGNAMTISGNNKVETIDKVIIVAASGYNCSSGYEFTAHLSDETTQTLSYSESGITMPSNTVSFTIKRTDTRSDLASITVEYTKVSQDPDVDAASVTLSDDEITLESGETYTLTATVLPVNARTLEVTWSSDDESVARVNQNGVVTAVAPGTCNITATSNDEIVEEQPSGSCEVTVTAGPVINHTMQSAIADASGSILNLSGVHFTLTKSGGTYTGYENARGAQFSSNSTAVNVQLQFTDIAVATEDLRVIIHASRNANGTATLKTYLGDSQLGSTQTLGASDDEYEFEYSGSSSSTVTLSNLLKFELNNTGGAVFIKSIKVYSAATGSNIQNFIDNNLRMDTYDKDGEQGSTGGNGSCKTWWNDVITAYNGLTTEQKALFATEDQYANAALRFSEWARINGHSFNTTTGALTQSAFVNPIELLFSGSKDNTVLIVIIMSILSVTALGGYFFLRKKKEN